MATIRKGDHGSLPARHVRYSERVEQAKALATTLTETGGTITEARHGTHTAADGKTLRGIPAIGPSVAGHIPGTQPESAATR